MGKRNEMELEKVTCRKCGFGPYIPSASFDFYPDEVDGPGTGLCENCCTDKNVQLSPPVELTVKQSKTLCKDGMGAKTCRFLLYDTGGFKCSKKSDCHSYIQSRAENMRAKGDNCSGPPNFVSLSRNK